MNELSSNLLSTQGIKMPSLSSKKQANALPPPPPEVISQCLGIEELTIDWLAGDGSDRCYYRISSKQLPNSVVLMQLSNEDAKKLEDHGYEWIQISKLLAHHGLRVPATIATLPDYAALLIEDYGNAMLETSIWREYQEKNWEEIVNYYRRSCDILIEFTKIPKTGPWCDRRFDSARFKWELDFFKTYFLEGVAKDFLTSEELRYFQSDSQALSDYLSSGDEVFVHRDFHSRNLMVWNNQLAILDFQDARLGPISYDIVSLIFDSYVPLSNEQRLNLLEFSLSRLESSIGGDLSRQARKQWKAMLLQRQLKAIGSFAYLSIEKNKGNYLAYVPKALETLQIKDLFDERWPFLSSDIIEKVKLASQKI